MKVLCAILCYLLVPSAEAAAIVINEIFYAPPGKARELEFIELHNPASVPVKLDGWRMEQGIKFTFPAGTTLAPGGYGVLARSPEAMKKEFGVEAFGPFTGALSNGGEKLGLRDAAGAKIEEFSYGVGFPWPAGADGGGSSIERVNPLLPAAFASSWRSSRGERQRPTPGARNSVFADKLPLSIDQVAHAPVQPRAGEPLRIGARVVASGGTVRAVTLSYQLVDPGAYLSKEDPEYEKQWTPVSMHDDGKNGDTRAADSIFTAVLPTALSTHRRLIRYRIIAVDTADARTRAPAEDDACPNFAAFVFNGEPAWTGAMEPGKTPPITFPSTLMRTLPSLTLLARGKDVERSQWDGGFNKKRLAATLVAAGRVYDHIQFHNRGQASTYVAGKNKWGFHFNRARDFAARDTLGPAFSKQLDGLTLHACASPWVASNRGISGLDEAVSFRLYELAGVPSPRTRHVQLRVIDAVEEVPPKDQFAGDLWGLYLVVEELGGDFLDARDLPDGNVYRIAGGGDKKHQGATQPRDAGDWNRFVEASRANQPEAWWRANLDLAGFYGFHAINRLVGNVDLRENENHAFYHRDDNRWVPIPWDLDMMFVPKGHQSGRIDQDRCLDLPALRLEYRNYCRELLDLLCGDATPRGGQVGQVIAEIAAPLSPPGFPAAWPELDACLWNHHPRNNARGAYFQNPMTGAPDGNWKRVLATADFGGFTKFLTDYCTDARPDHSWKRDDGEAIGYGYGFLRAEGEDPAAPTRPTLSYTGAPGFPSNALRFQCSPFTDPQGPQTCAAVQWRVAFIAAPGVPGYVAGARWRYEIEPVWTSAEIAPFVNTIAVPAYSIVSGMRCRARVRLKDDTGRWSRWSEAVEFTSGLSGR